MTDTREDILSLAACPHCEGQAKIVSGGPGNHYVRCTTCAAQTTDGSIERVMAAWNRRPSPPAPAVAVPEGLERLLTTSPIIEELTPRHHDWERCETIGDLYDMMKERIRAALRLLPAAPTPPAAEAPGQEPVAEVGKPQYWKRARKHGVQYAAQQLHFNSRERGLRWVKEYHPAEIEDAEAGWSDLAPTFKDNIWADLPAPTTYADAEAKADELQALFDKVKQWPENRMRPDAVLDLGEGFTQLLDLRNAVPGVIAAIRSLVSPAPKGET